MLGMVAAEHVTHCPLCHACYGLTAKCWAQCGHAQAGMAEGISVAQCRPDCAAWPTLTGVTTSNEQIRPTRFVASTQALLQ